MPQLEQVINKPLSGTDVRRIIMSKLETALATDSRLADFIAFPAFSFKLDLAIILAGAPEPHNLVNREVSGGQNEKLLTDNPGQASQIVTQHVEGLPIVAGLGPNDYRVDAGLGVPVLTRDEKGRQVEKEVKYAKEARRVAPPVTEP